MSQQEINQLTAAVANIEVSSPKAEFANGPQPEEGEEAEVYNKPFDRTFPSFAPMVDAENFLDEEYNAPVALLNNKFWQTEKQGDNYAAIKARAQKWFEPCNITPEELAEIESKLTTQINTMIADPAAKFDRIFIRDAERCFNAPARRTALCHMLTYLSTVTLNGDYHQGLAMSMSFLLCFLTLPQVTAMAIRANEKLLPGVWKSRSDASAIDGNVLYSLLQDSTNPEHIALHAHLTKCYAMPGMFVQKFWCGLCIHLLPFQSIITFHDRFWTENGVIALYETVLSILIGQRERLLKSDATNTVLDLVSVDHNFVTPDYVNKLTYVFERDAEGNEIIPQHVLQARELSAPLTNPETLTAKRDYAFKTFIEPLMARTERDFAALLQAAPDCARGECKKSSATGEYKCLDCDIHLCEDCAYSSWGGHNDDDHCILANFDLE